MRMLKLRLPQAHLGGDVVQPMPTPTPTPPSPPSGPMIRARVKALHDKVNSLLSTCNLTSTLDGMLLHSDTLCILRYEPQETRPTSVHGAMATSAANWSKNPGVSALLTPESPPWKTGVSALRTPKSPTQTPVTPGFFSGIPPGVSAGVSPGVSGPGPESPAYTPRSLRPK